MQANIPEAPSSKTSYASYLVSLGILLSRILGLVREQVMAHYLGNSDAAGAFRAALRIPNFLQNLFGEGVLSASFIPVYARLRAQHSDAEARRVAGTVGAILTLVVSLLVLLGVILTPWLVDLVAPGFDGDLKALTVRIVRILFPGVGLLALSAWCLGILNSHRRFFLSYVAPVFWNLALIATLCLYGPGSSQETLVVYMAWGSVVGSFLQFAVQLPFVFQVAGRIPFSIDRTLAPVREVFRNLAPVMLGRGVVQISAYIDGMIASFLGATAVAGLGYAQTIYLLPISLFGMAVAAAELPELSTIGDDAFGKLCQRISAGRRRIAYFVVPSVIAFTFLGREVVQVLYQTGRFSADDTVFVWLILLGSVIGVLAATWGRLYSSAFYALKDTRTPLKFALLRVAFSVVLGLLFAFPLRPQITAGLSLLLSALSYEGLPKIESPELALGAVGLTAASGIVGWLEFMLLKRSLEKRIGPTLISSGFLRRVWSAAIISAGAALALDQILGDLIAESLGFVRANFLALFPIGVYGALYLILTWIFDIDEGANLIRRTMGRLTSRLKR